MIETGHDIEIMNPDLVICTLDRDAKVSMEFTVETGKGYVASSQNRAEDAPIGLIPVDAVFSPVRRVAYKIENSRVGQVTDYDKLTLTVETNQRIPSRLRLASCRISSSSSSISKSRARPKKSAMRRRCRSTRTSCARSTNSNCRCVRRTA
jgi:DNA-directed RNA polymerase subunit alpha